MKSQGLKGGAFIVFSCPRIYTMLKRLRWQGGELFAGGVKPSMDFGQEGM